MKFYAKEDDFFKAENTLIEPSEVSIAKPITSLKLGKPGKFDWVRAHPSGEYRRACVALVEGPEGDKEQYLVGANMVSKVGAVVRTVELSAAVTKLNVPFIWPVPIIATAKDRENRYNVTHRDAYTLAQGQWIRMYADKQVGMYQVVMETAHSPEPIWLDLTFDQMLQLAFGDRYIANEDSPRYKELTGLPL